MAAAAAGPGVPLSPDELLLKGDLGETLSERLWGLTEMFPERVRSTAGAIFDLSLFVAQKMYRFSRAALGLSGGMPGLYLHLPEKSRLLLLYLTCLGGRNLKIQ
ncbi:hypothetical protein FD755_023445 [Muntiacus reevesi]|uniref:Mitochondrial import receptor subunit TOM22 homolog n=1 Tax=Muntiacus reevesi TaxID=9886 RepID=A0A5N3VY11_MUNRE|nr:hypothetical protein FD755_023445 [Muntiacus reevesi]